MKLGIEKIKSWIFVTGVIRSGTTFVGSILSLPLEVDYIHEPCNPQCGIPGIDRWYLYLRLNIETEEMQHYHQFIRSIFSYDFSLRSKIPPNDSWLRQGVKKIIGSRGPFYLRLAKINLFHTTAVIKDPIGHFLAEYLYCQFNVKPVIVIKHPLSFIASLKRVNWWPHLGEFNDQIPLIEDYFAREKEWIYREWPNPILAAAAYWRAVHQVFLVWRDRYPSWQFITHEELSQNPIAVFQHLYRTLDLPWSEAIKRKIIQKTQGNLSAEARKGRVQDFQRNSADIFEMRRNSLSLEERETIFEIVRDVALKIYSEESFALDD